MKIKYFCVLFLILLFAYCRSEKVYFPTKEGLTLEFQNLYEGDFRIDSPDHFAILVLPSRELKGKLLIPIKQTSDFKKFPLDIIYLVAIDSGGIYYYGIQSGDEIITYEKPVWMIRYPLQVGTEWEDNVETQLISEKIKISVRVRIESLDDVVSVPAGTFKKCLRISTIGSASKNFGMFGTAKIGYEYYAWYAHGVGMIKSVLKETSNHMLLPSGERVTELVRLSK